LIGNLLHAFLITDVPVLTCNITSNQQILLEEEAYTPAAPASLLGWVSSDLQESVVIREF